MHTCVWCDASTPNDCNVCDRCHERDNAHDHDLRDRWYTLQRAATRRAFAATTNADWNRWNRVANYCARRDRIAHAA